MGVNGIYGLSGSGLDIESMVKVGMMSKQNEYDKMQQNYTLNEWKKEAYLDVYNKIQTYSSSTLSTFKLQSNMNARNATSSVAEITATATSAAPAMAHNITVNNTATNAYLVGTEELTQSLYATAGNANSISFTLFDEAASVSFTGSNSGSSKLSDSLLNNALLTSLDSATKITAISTDTNGAITFSTTANGSSTTTTKQSTETALSFSVNNNTVNITYGDIAALLNEPTYEFDFSELISLLNNKMYSYGVTASYDSAGKGSLNFTNTKDASQISVTLNKTGMGATLFSSLSGVSENDTSLTLSDTTTSVATDLTINASTTYNDLAKAINNAGTNIRATFDATNNKFSIYNKDSGAKNIVGIVATNTSAQNVFNAMGLANSQNSSDILNLSTDTTSAVYTGKNASVTIDGVSLSNATNKITDKGVIYDITNVTSETTATVNVTQDVSKIVDNVKSFVESYNTLLSDLYKMYNEKQNSSYKPLTDAQKNEMTEEQVEKWEKKAKAGMLYHDSTIRKLIDNMRTAIAEEVTSVGGKYDNAYSIGIKTTGIYGQLQLDEDKLRAALTADPDSVSNVFTTLDSTLSRSEREKQTYFKQEGIAQRLGDIMNNAVKMITDTAGTSTDNSDDSTLSTLLRNLQSRMSSFRSMMDAFETKLYKKYDSMESSLAMLGSQLNYVTSSFGG